MDSLLFCSFNITYFLRICKMGKFIENEPKAYQIRQWTGKRRSATIKMLGVAQADPHFVLAPAVDILVVPVGIKQPVAQLHGATSPQVVRQFPQ